jgi:uncharacterized protein YjbI with pentapeptide repeats
MSDKKGRIDIVAGFSWLALWLILLLTPYESIAEDTTPTASIEMLQKAKLEREIEKLQTEIQAASSGWAKFTQIAPFITAIIALAGVFVTARKHISESNRQREADRRQLERERVRRFDEKFNQIVEGLGSSNSVTKAGAAVSILTYLRPEYSAFHEQVFLILMANLKLAHDETTNSLLVRAFEIAIRGKAKEIEKKNNAISEKEDKISLDISHTNLTSACLPGINLSWANAQESTLEKANLREGCLQRFRASKANLRKAQLSKTDLRKSIFDGAAMANARLCAADLRWAHFKSCDLRDAKFQRALLQSALFQDADLRGARFEQADINSAIFKGATLDNVAMRSIVTARNWRKADFDDDVAIALTKLELKLRGERDSPLTP